MGPKASTPADNTQSQEKLQISHPIFAIAQMIKDKEDQSFIKTQVRLANKNEFDAWTKRLNDVPANDSLMLPRAQYYTQEGLCGNSGIAHITYENFPYLLSDEVKNRECLNKKLFEENELWYLVYTLLSAAFTYHRQGTKVGDIRPDNVFINQDGQVKVACIDSWPGQQTNYAKAFYQKEITYLSPEEIKDYQFGKMEQSVDKELAQTFSIGLTSLDAATLSESKSLYSKNFKFNYQKLEQRLAEFRKYGYSELLTLTIENMCQVDTEFRASSTEILQWLLPYEQAIINLEDFQVTGLPQKMRLAREHQLQITGSSIQSTNQTSQYVNPTFIQAPISVPVYNVHPGQVHQNYSQQPPVQFSHYNPPTAVFKPASIINHPVNIKVVNNPGTYPVHAPKYAEPVPQGMQNYYAVNSSANQQYGQISGGQGARFTLEQINQQLQESRKLFPQ